MEYPVPVSARLLPMFLDPLLADSVMPRPLCALMPAVGTAGLLQGTALGLLCRCLAHPASRGPEVLGSLCLLAQPGAGGRQCGCVEAQLTCFQAGQSVCHHSCHRSPQNQTGAGTGSEMATSRDSLLLSYFPILLLFLWEFFLSKRRT